MVPKEPRLLWGMLLPSLRRGGSSFSPDGRPTYYLFWARNAIFHGLRVLRIQPGDNILVPSFHCTSVVEPILKYGAKVKFYDIGQNLMPDWDDIEAKIDAKSRAIIAIHYFGFPQPIRVFQRLCQARHLFLIEDCAHVLTGQLEDGIPMGRVGDVSIFSWRKFLPLYDGGQLVINNPLLKADIPDEKRDLFFSLKVAKNVLEKLIEDSDSKIVNRISRVSRLPSSMVRRLVCTNGHSPMAFAVNSYDPEFDLSSANLRMSALSKYILRNTDIAEVAAKRRRNYAWLLEAVAPLVAVAPLHPNLPANVCPWVFPLLVHGIKDFHIVLRAKGIPAFTWSGVIHRDLPLDRFPNSRFLYENLVFLPLHQSMGERELEIMTGVLRQELSARN